MPKVWSNFNAIASTAENGLKRPMNKQVDPGERLDIQSILSNSRPSALPWYRRYGLKWGSLVLVVLSAFRSRLVVEQRHERHPLCHRCRRQGELTVIVTATGTVQPTNKVDVSSELSGIIRKVLVDYNAGKGGPAAGRARHRQAEGEVDNSRAKLDAAKAPWRKPRPLSEEQGDLARNKKLPTRRRSRSRILDRRRQPTTAPMAALASARADVGVAEADLGLNETNLAKAGIRSPIDGVVLMRNVDPGQTVASSLQAPVLFTIAEDLKQMELQVDIDEADVGKVRDGQDATFTVDAYPDRKFPAASRNSASAPRRCRAS